MDVQERKLLRLVRTLSAQDRATLVAFAEFLAGRVPRPSVPEAPLAIPRPAEEKVVHAIRRLRETYPMLDHGKMLNQVSQLMTQHVMQGRPAHEVIDELELLFRAHYEKRLKAGEEDA
ncbi:hypothetical protein [Thiobacter aerophilum]|uniref:Crp/Fnr family transcriptional regulator n=1 Tax=Thiobacter aerophilum TaxID=3121275 RepID=A0ABV0EBB4_9BURK